MISKTESASIDADVRKFQSFANIMLSAWEQWFALNLEVLRSACSSLSVNSRVMVDEALRTQLAAYEENLERSAEYVRGVNRMCMSTQAALAELNADTVLDSTCSVPAFLDNVAVPAPLATYDVMAAVKSAVDNGGALYERLIQASRDLADSNLSAAARAFQPVRAASRRVARGARNLM